LSTPFLLAGGDWRLIAEKEKVLLLKLSMADEESNEDSIRKITDELMKVQKDKKKFMQ